MNPGRPHGALLLRQEGEPEVHSILWQSKWNLTLMVSPDSNRRAAQSTMDRLMIGADDVECDIPLEFTQCQCRVPLRVVVSQILFVAECGAREQVQPSHLCADQALDVTAEAGLTRWPPLNGDAGVLASSLECPAAEVGAVVDVNSVRQPRRGLEWIHSITDRAILMPS